MEDPLQSHLKLLSKIVGPVESWNSDSSLQATVLDDILKIKLKEYEQCISPPCVDCGTEKASQLDKNSQTSSDEVIDVRWKYVDHCLSFLSKLRDLIDSVRDQYGMGCSSSTLPNTNTLSPDTLSVSQKQEISKLIQLTLVLGSIPSFAPGVGLPFEKRTKFEIHLGLTLDTRYGKNDTEVAEEKYRRLAYVTKRLVNFITHDGLAEIILERHLDDLISSLIQLGYRPLQSPNENESESTTKPSTTKYVMTPEKFQILQTDQTIFRNCLLSILSKVYPPSAIKSLLLLQSTGAKEVVSPLPKSINTGKRLRTPKWVQIACGTLLSKQLTNHLNGVCHVIRGILDALGSDHSPDEGDTRKYQLIANVIGNPPKVICDLKSPELEDYYSLVCPQLLNILTTSASTTSNSGLPLVAEESSNAYRIIASACIQKLSERSATLSKQYILHPIMEPLMRLSKDDHDSVQTVVEESEMEKCIQQLHFLFLLGCDPSSAFIELLQPVIPLLLFIHCSICSGVSNVRSLVKQILERYLKQTSLDVALKTIRAFLFRESSDTNDLVSQDGDRYDNIYLPNRSILIRPGACGGITAVLDTNSDILNDDIIAAATVDLLQNEIFRELTVQFYLGLLKDLSDMSKDDKQSTDLNLSSAKVSDTYKAQLIENGGIKSNFMDEFEIQEVDKMVPEEQRINDEQKLKQIQKSFMVIRLMGIMSNDEQIQNSLEQEPTSRVEFLLSAIHRATIHYKETKNKTATMNKDTRNEFSLDSSETKSLEVSMHLLLQYISEKLETTTSETMSKPLDWDALKSATLDLQYLEECHTDKMIQTTASGLNKIIQTHGAVDLDDLHLGLKQKKSINKNPYLEALEHIEEQEVPTKGHGLITLTSLISKKNEQTLTNLDKVVQIFKANLEHEDTYIYLQSVNGLVACSSIDANLVISTLTDEYTKVLDDSETPPEAILKKRTKLGEALVRITMVAGKLTVVHMNLLLNPFLHLLRNNPSPHPDPMIRASCLSNIGNICKNLEFGIGGIVHEIFDCLINILKSDKSNEVQRAGVHVCVLILKGLGANGSIQVLGKEGLLRDLHRTIILMRDNLLITDEVTRQHILLALEEIDKIAKEMFLPGNNAQQMSKRIYVLDQPPNAF